MIKMWNETDVLHAEKQESFLQVGTTIFRGHGSACLDSQSTYRVLRWESSHKDLIDCLDILHE